MSSVVRLASEESSTLRGIISPEHPSIDLKSLDRLIAAGKTALDHQVELLREALDEYQGINRRAAKPKGSSREGTVAHTGTLQRLEFILEHTARLVHEAQVLQKLKGLLYNA